MKRIPLKVIPDPRFPIGSEGFEQNVIVYSEVVRQVIRRPLDQQKGADIEEMRKGIRILDQLDKSTTVLELEDADWEHLKTKTNAMPWAFVDKRIIEFVDLVNAATDTITLNDSLNVNIDRADGRLEEPVQTV